jgi:hypothetical protein
MRFRIRRSHRGGIAVTEDDLNSIMWAGFLKFALSEPKMRKAFTDATGVAFLSPPKNAIEAMIDDASGARDDVIAKFVEWVTREHWGIEYAPKAYRDSLAARPAP